MTGLISAQFDDVKTHNGWGNIPTNYSELVFDGLLALRPDASALEGLISEHDLNCAVSSPNAVYGTRYNHNPPTIPQILLVKGSRYSSFSLVSLKVKPLNMPPLGYATLKLRGLRRNQQPLDWSVDFPHGFQDMFTVDIENYSGTKWKDLNSLQITADFVNDGHYMDWEFCMDDFEVILQP
jgi:hypothetical protein